MTDSILVVDDEKNMRFVVGRALRSAGHDVSEAASGEEALRALGKSAPSLVLLDQRMPGMDGLATLKEMKRRQPELPVVMLTAHGNIEDAVKAMKAGASDYLTKPFDVEELKLAVEKALKLSCLERQVDFLREELGRDYDTSGVIGESAQMQEVLATVRRVAATDATVMIYGESGTGKELIARAIHNGSPRARGPFVQLSCAALPETLLESELFGYEKGAFTGATGSKPGRFELADGGSLFLDEIGDISPAVQVKLLRVLETMTFERLGSNQTVSVDVRLIGATNRDLPRLISEGGFREDLYYRLNVIPVCMPPLRDRPGDIKLLAKHFLARHAPGKDLSPEALRHLEDYRWPGNVRELINTIERAGILSPGPVIGPGDLPAEVRAGTSPAAGGFELPPEGVTLEQVEKELIEQALARTGGNRTKAAGLLGISRHTLLYRIEKYHIG
ncbi:MAG: sigma-54-dependent Fis family transcriptional regulator [Thermoleophilia bacterium]|nr:sigma-54-dependent Fis family transcriptional regulator [Thermoleophilia bacterium]